MGNEAGIAVESMAIEAGLLLEEAVLLVGWRSGSSSAAASSPFSSPASSSSASSSFNAFYCSQILISLSGFQDSITSYKYSCMSLPRVSITTSSATSLSLSIALASLSSIWDSLSSLDLREAFNQATSSSRPASLLIDSFIASLALALIDLASSSSFFIFEFEEVR
ncbi:hypothetical protein LWI29_018375 [Acer saccharum]|uniref:Uncharacterized protein n=1 Tax=Acer saccharum TaxID=4024 RepID=A0AA39TCI7_ACESA|nr:hypothetical protein LWI29_018375 [Acer saccharum]